MSLSSLCACFKMNTCTCHTLRLCRPRRYGEDSALKALFSTCTHVQQLCTQPIGHMQAHVWKFVPSDSAYGRAACRAIMAAIMRLSNIAMAYVHVNCREWRRLLHHVAPCSFQNAFKPSHGAIKQHRSSTIRHVKHTYFLHSVTEQQRQREREERERESCNAESVACTEEGTMLEAHKVWVTCSSTRGLNIYLFVTQGSLTVKSIVVKKKGGVGLYVWRVYRLHNEPQPEWSY